MKSKRNSLIEFLRFFFALNVVKNHGYFPYQGPYFTPGRISVEFFFILSGYLFAKSIYKYKEGNVGKNIWRMLSKKLLTLGVPLAIGLAFNIAYVFVCPDFVTSIWGYMWYVHEMLIVFIVYILLRKLIQNDKVFWITVASIGVISFGFHSINMFYTWGYFRAFFAISFGMIVAKIPPVKKENHWFAIALFVVSSILILRLMLFNFGFKEDELLNLFLYPILVYSAFQINCDNKVFNYLGSLSFGLYAYQSIPRFLEMVGYENPTISFIIILSCTLVTDLVKRIIVWNKSKKQIQIVS